MLKLGLWGRAHIGANLRITSPLHVTRSGLRAGRLARSNREDPTFVLSRANAFQAFLTSEVKLVNHLTARTHCILTYEVKQFELKTRAATGLEFFGLGLITGCVMGIGR